MVYVEIWIGGLRNPAYSFMATKTETTNDGSAVRLYATNGDVFETSIHNVVMQILGEEKENFCNRNKCRLKSRSVGGKTATEREGK